MAGIIGEEEAIRLLDEAINTLGRPDIQTWRAAADQAVRLALGDDHPLRARLDDVQYIPTTFGYNGRDRERQAKRWDERQRQGLTEAANLLLLAKNEVPILHAHISEAKPDTDQSHVRSELERDYFKAGVLTSRTSIAAAIAGGIVAIATVVGLLITLAGGDGGVGHADAAGGPEQVAADGSVGPDDIQLVPPIEARTICEHPETVCEFTLDQDGGRFKAIYEGQVRVSLTSVANDLFNGRVQVGVDGPIQEMLDQPAGGQMIVGETCQWSITVVDADSESGQVGIRVEPNPSPSVEPPGCES